MSKQTIHLAYLPSCSIFEQLQIEEAFLRTDVRNLCLINQGTDPAIVLGISGKLDELVNRERFDLNPVPLVRRFSGGGTVFVDQNTLFVTFVGNSELLQSSPCCPQKVGLWSGEIYKEVFENLPFELIENDYVLFDKKCGGNAQYLSKTRWLHHTSFLWDFDVERMEYLLHPRKAPKYRVDRKHGDFLCTLNKYFPSSLSFIEKLRGILEQRFQIIEISLEVEYVKRASAHRRSTQFIHFSA